MRKATNNGCWMSFRKSDNDRTMRPREPHTRSKYQRATDENWLDTTFFERIQQRATWALHVDTNTNNVSIESTICLAEGETMLHTLEKDSTMFLGLETYCDFCSEGEAFDNQVD